MKTGRWRQFVVAVLRTATPKWVDAVNGSWSPLVTLALGVAVFVAGDRVLEPPIPLVVLLGSVVAAVLIAAYKEWSRWAPYPEPRLVIDGFQWTGYAGVFVTNDDIDGNLRADIIDVKGRCHLVPIIHGR